MDGDRRRQGYESQVAGPDAVRLRESEACFTRLLRGRVAANRRRRGNVRVPLRPFACCFAHVGASSESGVHGSGNLGSETFLCFSPAAAGRCDDTNDARPPSGFRMPSQLLICTHDKTLFVVAMRVSKS